MMISKRNADGYLVGLFRNGDVPGITGKFTSLPARQGDFTYRRVMALSESAINPWEHVTGQKGPEVGDDDVDQFFPVVEDLPLDEVRLRLKELLAAERYRLETGGITFSPASGPDLSVSTDRDSQVRVWGFYLRVSQMEATASVIWKHPDGYISLIKADALRMASEVGRHIQEAFDREAAVAARIDAAVSLDMLKKVRIDLSDGGDSEVSSLPSEAGT
tara:strand:+ start:3733 stop:4386 length:654 start_codon:yes stop_codon:yes gene_type:complete